MSTPLFARLPKVLPLVALLACVAVAPANGAEAATPQKSPESTADKEALQLPEVLGGATTDLLELREFENAAAAPGKVQEIDEQLSDPERDLPARSAEAKKQIAKAQRVRDLEELENAWRRERADIEAWREAVTQRALRLQRDIEEVDALRERWDWAAEEARRLAAPAPVLGRIGEMLGQVSETREKISDQWSLTLRVQGRVGEDLAAIDALLERASEARGAIQEALLTRGPVPIWEALRASGSDQRVADWADENLSKILSTGKDFPARNRGRLLLHALILVLAIGLARVLRPQALRRAAEDPTLEPTAQILSHPYAAGVLIAALATLFIYQNPPRVVMLIAGFFALLALLRLLPALFSSSGRPRK